MIIFKEDTTSIILNFITKVVRGLCLLAIGFAVGYILGRYPQIITLLSEI